MKKLSAQKLILITFVTVGVLGAGFILSDRLVVSLKNPGEVGVANNKVCSSKLLAEYNTTFSAESREQYTERLGNVASKVSELKDASNDPNCVYIQYTNYLEQKDIDKARERLDVLKKLAKQDAYITGELANPEGLESAEQTLSILEASKDKQPGSSGQENSLGEG